MNVEIRRQNIIFCFRNNGAMQFHLVIYKSEPEIILDSHRPFIGSEP